MKHLTLTLLFIAISLSGFGQSHADHDAVMEKFKRFYNANMSDSISKLIYGNLWDRESLNQIREKYGDIQSVEHIGLDENKVTNLYKIVASKKTFALGISMNKSKVGNFRFDTRSEHINKLMGIEEPEYPKHPQEDYDKTMARFRKFYNTKMDDSIAYMFSGEVWEKDGMSRSRLWEKGSTESLMKDYGEIKLFTFIGEMNDDPSVKLYKVVATKKTYVTGLSLDNDNQFLTFRFHTSSKHIDNLMKQSK